MNEDNKEEWGHVATLSDGLCDIAFVGLVLLLMIGYAKDAPMDSIFPFWVSIALLGAGSLAINLVAKLKLRKLEK